MAYSKKMLVLVDSNSFLNTGFRAQETNNPEAVNLAGVNMLLFFMLNIQRKLKHVDNIIFTFDCLDKTFREEIYPPYKEDREEKPQELKDQIELAYILLFNLGFKVMRKDGFEADDLIASLTKKAVQENYLVTIVGKDKDFNQLIEKGKVGIYDIGKNTYIDGEAVFKKFKVKASQFRDYQALVGDSSDGIPGVKGIGEKTAIELLSKNENLEEIYSRLHDEEYVTKSRKTPEILKEKITTAYFCRFLATLKTDISNLPNFNETVFPRLNPTLASNFSRDLINNGLSDLQRYFEKEGFPAFN